MMSEMAPTPEVKDDCVQRGWSPDKETFSWFHVALDEHLFPFEVVWYENSVPCIADHL